MHRLLLPLDYNDKEDTPDRSLKINIRQGAATAYFSASRCLTKRQVWLAFLHLRLSGCLSTPIACLLLRSVVDFAGVLVLQRGLLTRLLSGSQVPCRGWPLGGSWPVCADPAHLWHLVWLLPALTLCGPTWVQSIRVHSAIQAKRWVPSLAPLLCAKSAKRPVDGGQIEGPTGGTEPRPAIHRVHSVVGAKYVSLW
jgi:hypothetical protein